jgi:hypothetical protein
MVLIQRFVLPGKEEAMRKRGNRAKALIAAARTPRQE